MNGSSNFLSYRTALQRLLFTEMLDEHLERNRKRRLSIVGPCYTHEQWLAKQAEQKQRAAMAEHLDPPKGL